jgi:hypothetical protein
MARYRIIRRPFLDDPFQVEYEVEEACPYMDASGNLVATYWGLNAPPFKNLTEAEDYVQRLIDLADADNFVVKEYD